MQGFARASFLNYHYWNIFAIVLTDDKDPSKHWGCCNFWKTFNAEYLFPFFNRVHYWREAELRSRVEKYYVKVIVENHCSNGIEIEGGIIVNYSNERGEHTRKDKGSTTVISLNSQRFSKSTLEYRTSTNVSFNILTRNKIFTQEDASRTLTDVKPCCNKKDDKRGDTEFILGRKLFFMNSMTEKWYAY